MRKMSTVYFCLLWVWFIHISHKWFKLPLLGTSLKYLPQFFFISQIFTSAKRLTSFRHQSQTRWFSTYPSGCLPGEVHGMDIDRDGWHPLLGFSEIMSEGGHLPLWDNQNILFKAWKNNLQLTRNRWEIHPNVEWKAFYSETFSQLVKYRCLPLPWNKPPRL